MYVCVGEHLKRYIRRLKSVATDWLSLCMNCITTPPTKDTINTYEAPPDLTHLPSYQTHIHSCMHASFRQLSCPREASHTHRDTHMQTCTHAGRQRTGPLSAARHMNLNQPTNRRPSAARAHREGQRPVPAARHRPPSHQELCTCIIHTDTHEVAPRETHGPETEREVRAHMLTTCIHAHTHTHPHTPTHRCTYAER